MADLLDDIEDILDKKEQEKEEPVGGTMFGIELGTATGLLTFGGTVVLLGVITGLIMLLVLRILEEKYHIFV